MKINLELRREGDNGRSTYGALYMDGAFRAGLAASTVGAFGRSHYSQFDDELPPPYTNNRPLCKIELVDRI